uniref:HXXXD-type acyl-transferase family protein n=1 Tax=Leersia perrieri TaxID=77586 RepID=A0A0D9W980_9ORYZ
MEPLNRSHTSISSHSSHTSTHTRRTTMVHETTKEHGGHDAAVTVTVTSTSTVAPALPLQEHRLPLSNLDLILPPMDVGVFFCYGDALPAATLKAALAKVLVAYYPLAGEVVANAAGEPELLCSGRGVDFAEASAGDAALRELRLGLVDESAEKLVPKKKNGVMCVQVTKFRCGGAVVGCTFDHRICDAYSFNMFLVSWAAAARGSSSAAPAPSFDRSFLAPSSPSPPRPDALSCKLFVPVSRVPPSPPPAAAVNRIFRVAAADVAALQASAGPGRTKLEAFTAHLWQLHARAQLGRGRRGSCCSMGVVVDGRTRIRRDGAMEAYFGNVLTIPYGAMCPEDLVSATSSLADVAGDVHGWVTEATTRDHFRGLVDFVESLRPEPTVARAYLGGGDDDGVEEEAMACVVSSGMRFPVGGVDFGWGRPAFASYHFPWPGGAGYVMPMPSARGDGDWVVYVHAAREVVEAMEGEEDTVFRALESDYVFGRVQTARGDGDWVVYVHAAADVVKAMEEEGTVFRAIESDYVFGRGHEFEVTITATSTVAPPLPLQEHRLPLSNLDLLLPPIDVGVFFCYAAAGVGVGEAAATQLKVSLENLLVEYYPLAGVVVANAAGEPELLCSGRGVDFAEAIAGDVELRELRLGMPDESAGKLVPTKKAGVMSVQVTTFKCGGAVVGCTFFHGVCDAHSFNTFLLAWAAAASSAATPPPSFDRSLLAPSDPPPPRHDALAVRLYAPVTRITPPPPPTTDAAAVANRIFRVAANDVAALQASAGPGRTKLEAFTAHLWQLHARVASTNSPSNCCCCMGVVVDGRARLGAAMDAYFGNVLTIPYGAMSPDALSAMSLADVADDVHMWVSEAATGDHFRGLVDWVEEIRPERMVAKAYLGAGDGDANAMACVVSSGMRFPAGEVDFGWGRPAFASYHFPWPGGAGLQFYTRVSNMVKEEQAGDRHDGEVTIAAVTTTVAPALPTQEHRLPLSNLDLLLPPLDVSVFFCYTDPAPSAAALKEALAKALVAYYPLAGEVVANGDGEPELMCSGRGVDFTEVSAAEGEEMRALRIGLVDERVERLVPAKKAGVLAVQVTKFKCGGAVVGCTFDHRVCDAYSFNMFLLAWAAAARHANTDSETDTTPPPPIPSFRRSLLAPRDPPPPRSPSTDALIDRLFAPLSSVPPPPAPAAVNRIYRVAAADVAALQASAGPGRTKLEAFTAHLWLLHARVAEAHPRLPCCMGVVVDGRRRLQRTDEMSAYFGNVLTIPYGVMDPDEILLMPLSEVACDVHGWVAEAATGEHFRALVDWVETRRPKPAAARAYVGGGEGATSCIVSSGMRFPAGDVDFGWGRPAFASYHFPWPGGAGYVMPMPSARGDGDWVVYVHAAREVVEAMEGEDTVFRAIESDYVFG